MSKENPPKIKTCACCGKIFDSNVHNRKYCENCAKVAWKHRSKELNKKRSIEARDAQKSPHPAGTVVCTASVMKKCKYGGTCGGTPCCNYILIKKESRGCSHRACDKYKSGPKLSNNQLNF